MRTVVSDIFSRPGRAAGIVSSPTHRAALKWRAGEANVQRSVLRADDHSREGPDAPVTQIDSSGRRLVRALVATTLLSLSGPAALRGQDPAVFYIGGAALAAVVPGFLFDLPQPDAERPFIKTSLGRFDAVDQENMALDFIIEFQPGVTWHRIKPLLGVAGNDDATFYAWIAAAHDFHIADHIVVNVNSGPAVYLAGERGKALGSRGALRSGVEVGYRFGDGARVTGSFHHMSHGKLLNHDQNPGTEVIALNVSWPLQSGR